MYAPRTVTSAKYVFLFLRIGIYRTMYLILKKPKWWSVPLGKNNAGVPTKMTNRLEESPRKAITYRGIEPLATIKTQFIQLTCSLYQVSEE